MNLKVICNTCVFYMPTHVNFIGRMKRSQGNYTDDQTARCCELRGDQAKSLDHVFTSNSAGYCQALPAKASDVVRC